jgi:hypothetical protein
MKKIYILLTAFMLIPMTVYGQQSVSHIFNKYSNAKGVESVNVGSFLMFIGGLFEDTKGVTGVEVLNFDSCEKSVKDNVRKAIRSIDEREYEILVSVKEDKEQLKVLSRMKDDYIRELVIVNTGDDPALIRIRGKIKPSDIQELINQ